MNLLTKALASWITAAALTAAAYPLILRKRCLTWGSYPEEAEAILPGDDLLPDPDHQTTRAVTIAAPPEAVWPLLTGPHPGMRPARRTPARSLVYRTENRLRSFTLHPTGEATRLIARTRTRHPGRPARLLTILKEPTDLLRERRLLLTLKQRAEAATPPRRPLHLVPQTDTEQ
ncbi:MULTISPECIES: hypothetical protein [Thermomonospora]|uniref:Uncharacterized protein n=1 Tax=Thermomonospora cellulosilytica TaxID=1411118 RepID=A0A7W3MZX8_9ACTN|nr:MULTISPECIES: hypothetical protein [Thermomonospora]MBA9004973.1 hypothetical protein [Thermomonospora cellulosilytica]